jgi:hypothetical protein
MRLNPLFSWLLLCGTLAFVAVVGAQAQTPAPTRVPGRIIAAKVAGTVTAILPDGSRSVLTNNAPVAEKSVITTAADASVILVFSNGATVNLGANSSLSIKRFLQDPFDSQVTASDLTDEPSTSDTELELTRGELVGNVKHLRKEKGSSFTVNTPVGAAGIRGTTFRIVFRPDASGKVFFTLSTAEGAILFEAPANTGVSVESGKEVAISVDVTVDAAGKVSITTPPTVGGTTEISAANKAIIAVAAQQSVEAASSVVIEAVKADKAAADKAAADKAAADKAAADKATADKAAADKAAAAKAAEQESPLQNTKSTTPDPTIPASNLTPGDGRPTP